MNAIISKLRRKMRTFRQTNPRLFIIFEAYDSIDNYGGGKNGNAGNRYSGAIFIKQVQKIKNIAFIAECGIVLENLGIATITFQLYQVGNPVGKAIQLAPNSKLSTTLRHFEAEGDAIYVTNNSTTSVGKWAIVHPA